MLSRRFFKVAAAIILFGLVYAVVAKFSLRLACFAPSASPVWPPIFVGAFFVNFTTAGNLLTSLCIATGSSLEVLCAAWLVTRFAGGVRVFERAQDVFKFVFIAIVCSTISATIGPTSLTLNGF